MGDHRGLAQAARHARCAFAPGRSLHARRKLGRRREAAGRRRTSPLARRARGPCRPSRRDGGPRDPHRHPHGDREGLLPRSGDGRAQRGASRHPRRSCIAAPAAIGDRLPRRGAAASARRRHRSFHRGELRQLARQWPDPATRRGAPREASRPRSRRLHRRRGRLSLDHGRPHRAGDDGCRSRRHLGASGPWPMPGPWSRNPSHNG